MIQHVPLRGNPAAEAALAAFSGGRVPHGILIEGPAGSGKSSFARLVAMSILCREEENRPCGACPSCKKALAGSHPDILTYEGEKGKAKSFHVEKVRALRGQAYVQPNESDRKVLILEDAHNMTEQAQNALLKVLEEPPASTVLILTCLARSQLLETILSRVVLVSLQLPAWEDCVAELGHRLPDMPLERLEQAARDARGSVGLALEALAGQEDGAAKGHQECAVELLRLLEEGKEAAALARLTAYERDRSGFLAMLEALSGQVTERLLGRVPMGRLTRWRLVRIATIIEEIEGAAYSNVGGLLLGSTLVAKISAELAG